MKRAIAIGTTAAAIVFLILVGASLFAWRKRRQRKSRAFTPFGGYFQPDRRPAKPYKSFGDGSEQLMSPGTALSRGEKYTLPPLPEDDEEEDLGAVGLLPSTPSPKRRLTRTFLRDAPIRSQAPHIMGVAAVAAQPRRHMLADEDNDDRSWVDLGRSKSIRPVIEGREEDMMEKAQIQSELDQVDDIMGLYSTMAGCANSKNSKKSSASSGTDTRGVCASDDYSLRREYDQHVIDYAEGLADAESSHSSSRLLPTMRNISGETSHSNTDSAASQPNASVLVARKTSLDSQQASYVPFRRRDSLLRRLAGDRFTSIFGNFNEVEVERPQYLEVRDPAPPPRLDPLEDSSTGPQVSRELSGPTAFHGNALAFDVAGMHSVSSILTNGTAHSAVLARYGMMDIGQRQREASSTTDVSVSVPPSEANSTDVSPVDIQRGSASGTSSDMPRGLSGALTSFPVGPSSLRPVTKPSGRRPASPIKRLALGVPDRTVRDIAASINKRNANLNRSELPAPNPIGVDATLQNAPAMISPSRGIRPPQGPRAKTVYLMQERQPLTIANE